MWDNYIHLEERKGFLLDVADTDPWMAQWKTKILVFLSYYYQTKSMSCKYKEQKENHFVNMVINMGQK